MVAEKWSCADFDLEPVLDGLEFYRDVGADARCAVGKAVAGGSSQFEDGDGIGRVVQRLGLGITLQPGLAVLPFRGQREAVVVGHL